MKERAVIQRMIRAARLDARVYQELRDDPTATVQAFGVMVLGSFALALGGIVGFSGGVGLGAQLRVFAWSISSAMVGWFVLGLLAYWTGRRLLGRMVTLPSLLRTIGFANVPGIFYFLIFVSGVTALMINAAILIWILLAMIMALRQTLQVSFLAGFWLSAFGIFIALNIRDVLARTLT